MTIKECIDIVDNIKPNQYTVRDKVMWLSFLDEIIITDVLKTHEGYDERYDDFEGYSEEKLSVPLVVPSPYDKMYPEYLKMQIDKENGETPKYNNSRAVYDTYYMEYRKHYNKTHMPLSTSGRRDTKPHQKATTGLSDAEYENIKRDLYYLLTNDLNEIVSPDKLYDIVTSYAQNNAEMLKGKDGYTPVKGVDYLTENDEEKYNSYISKAEKASISAENSVKDAEYFAQEAEKSAESVDEKISGLDSFNLKTKAFLIDSYGVDEVGNKYYILSAGALASELCRNMSDAISSSKEGLYYTVKNNEYASGYGKILGAEAINDTIKITVDKLYTGGSANSLPGTVLVYENKTTEGAFTNHKDTFWSVCGDVSRYKSLRFKARTSDVHYLAFSFMKKDGTWVHNAGNKDALIKLNQGTQFEEYALDLTSFPEWNGEIEYIHINQKTPDWQSGYKGTVEFAEITLDEQPIYSWDFENYNSQRWKISDWSAADGVALTYANGEMTYSQAIVSGGRAFAIWDKSFIANDYKALKIRVKSPDSWVKGLNLDVRGTLSNGAGNIWYTSIRNITAEYQDFIINFADSDNWKDSIISRLSFLLVDAKGEDTTGTVVIDSIELIPNDNVVYDTYTWDFETPETCLWESPNRATSKVTYEYIAPSLGFSIQNRETDETDASLFLCGYKDIGVIDIELNSLVYGNNNCCCAKNSMTVGENLKAGENVRLFGEDIDARNAKDSFSTGRNNIIEGFVKNIFQHGVGLVSAYSDQIQFGRYNENKERNILEIGIGDNSLDRKNIFEIDKDGNMYVNGDMIKIEKKDDEAEFPESEAVT